MLPENVKKYIAEHELIRSGDKVLLAVSGGADSMALLDIFQRLAPELQISLHIAHLNHMFRGEEARMDAEFVRLKAREMGIPATILAFDVAAYRDEHKMSSQDAARRVRYGLFLKVAVSVGATKMAVAHHRDDQVETILLNILRGTGPEGLRGILPLRRWQEGQNLDIIRPLLEVSREEIETYVQKQGIPFRLDRTNLQDKYLRNKVRLRLLPLLEKEYNPAIREALLSLSAVVSESEEYMQQETLTAWSRVLLSRRPEEIIMDREQLSKEPKALQGKLLRYALRQLLPGLRGVTYGHIKALRKLASAAKTGASLTLPGKVQAVISYRELQLRKQAKEKQRCGAAKMLSYSLPVPGEIVLTLFKKRIRATILPREEAPWPPDEKREAVLDYDRLIEEGGKVCVRGRRPGDRFQPLGLKGSKKLKDYFIDKKIPRNTRDCLPLVTVGSDILWIVGMAIHDRFKVSTETKRILYLEVEDLGSLPN